MRGKDTGRTSFTNGQVALHKMIEELHIAADMEVEFGPFCVDIYISETHTAIEFDGSGHLRKRDRIRDQRLMEKFQLPVLRVKNLSPKSEIQGDIINFLAKGERSAKTRKAMY